jgi:hypothetical protein
MNARKIGLWFIVALHSSVLIGSEADVGNSDSAAVQEKSVAVADELDKDKVSGDKVSEDTVPSEVDPKAQKSGEQAADKPIFSANDEFKPSEQVSEDLSVPFPIDI